MSASQTTGAYNQRHGGPYDRGAADAWYSRPKNPHYYAGATYSTPRIPQADMTQGEIDAYNAGYDAGPYGGKVWD